MHNLRGKCVHGSEPKVQEPKNEVQPSRTISVTSPEDLDKVKCKKKGECSWRLTLLAQPKRPRNKFVPCTTLPKLLVPKSEVPPIDPVILAKCDVLSQPIKRVLYENKETFRKSFPSSKWTGGTSCSCGVP